MSNFNIENVAIDLETFSQHASRSTVTTDDVLLLARKNADLQEILKQFVDDAKAVAAVQKGTAGARGGSKGKGKAKGR